MTTIETAEHLCEHLRKRGLTPGEAASALVAAAGKILFVAGWPSLTARITVDGGAQFRAALTIKRETADA